MSLTTSTGLVAGGSKRLCDIVLSFAALVLLCPLLLVVSAAVLIDSGRPVFFLQERIGLHGKTFRIVKFRTMVRGAETLTSGVQVSGDHPLVTRVGRVLRRTKMDELPQLLNVVRGEMSLVGPRPAPASVVATFSQDELRRFTVRPGMTGWAQTHGNVALTWPERCRYDLFYVDNWSLKLDCVIMIRTIAVLLLGEERLRDRRGGS
jgi:lipopolysaccharide/colanic/teichoic acid biosynthesis glycosyltransferase